MVLNNKIQKELSQGAKPVDNDQFIRDWFAGSAPAAPAGNTEGDSLASTLANLFQVIKELKLLKFLKNR